MALGSAGNFPNIAVSTCAWCEGSCTNVCAHLSLRTLSSTSHSASFQKRLMRLQAPDSPRLQGPASWPAELPDQNGPRRQPAEQRVISGGSEGRKKKEVLKVGVIGRRLSHKQSNAEWHLQSDTARFFRQRIKQAFPLVVSVSLWRHVRMSPMTPTSLPPKKRLTS